MCLIFSKKAFLPKLMELYKNPGKPSLVPVGSGPLSATLQYEGENLLSRDSIFFQENVSFFICFSQC